MSKTSPENKEKWDKEKENLLKRWIQIQKEEEQKEEQAKEETNQIQEAYLIQPDLFIRQFNKDDNDDEDINIKNKVEKEKDSTWILTLTSPNRSKMKTMKLE
jgi:hypothetical protein